MAQAKRAPPKRASRAGKAPTGDSYQNFEARVGIGSGGPGNVAAGASYALNPITRTRVDLDYMYRGSWIVGVAVDAPADDMTREGINFNAGIDPDEADELHNLYDEMGLWQELAHGLRWSNLYGGALVAMLIDGQDMATPLRPETIGPGQFRGLLALDRWQLQPTITDIVTEMGPNFGMPNTYQVVTSGSVAGAIVSPLYGQRIHHSRVFRFDGVPLPFYQRQAEYGWGMSAIERLYDRLVAFDSTTQGAAQLVFKAHLRTVYIDGLTNILGSGDAAMKPLLRRMESMRRFQSFEGMTLLDAKDKLEVSTYAFSGLGDLMLQFAQQISGALQIPLVRLLGQSPAGLNSTGESDLRTYYDGIKKDQRRKLKVPVTRLNRVLYRSHFGKDPDENFGFDFNPLWLISEAEKATIAQGVTQTVTGALAESVVSRATALKELRKSSRITGVWSNISDEDIEQAEDDPPPASELTPEQLIAQSKVDVAEADETKARAAAGETSRKPPAAPEAEDAE